MSNRAPGTHAFTSRNKSDLARWLILVVIFVQAPALTRHTAAGVSEKTKVVSLPQTSLTVLRCHACFAGSLAVDEKMEPVLRNAHLAQVLTRAALDAVDVANLGATFLAVATRGGMIVL